jgi:hypothetical protein
MTDHGDKEPTSLHRAVALPRADRVTNLLIRRDKLKCSSSDHRVGRLASETSVRRGRAWLRQAAQRQK